MGTVAGAARPAPVPPPDPKAVCARKLAQIEADIRYLETARAGLRKDAGRRGREVLEGAVSFQLRRIEWLKTAARTKRADLEARLAAIEAELGEDGRRFLAQGLPESLAKDQRFMDLLGEAAIIKYVLEAG
jgi:uncharacterized membrane protein